MSIFEICFILYSLRPVYTDDFNCNFGWDFLLLEDVEERITSCCYELWNVITWKIFNLSTFLHASKGEDLEDLVNRSKNHSCKLALKFSACRGLC